MKKIAANRNYKMIKRASPEGAKNTLDKMVGVIQDNISVGLTEFGSPETGGYGLSYNFKLNLILEEDPHRGFVQKAIESGSNAIPEYLPKKITPDRFHLEPFLNYKQSVVGSESSELTEFVKEKFDKEKNKAENVAAFNLLSNNDWTYNIPVKVIPAQYSSEEEVDF
jgi:hypothetical protein